MFILCRLLTMRLKSLFLFPDTNLFLECHTLKDIDWSTLGDYDEINLLLSKPVLDEIDLHKKGTGRRRRQATNIFNIAREIVRQRDRNYLQIKDNPVINLYLCTDNYYRHFSKPSLDLTKPDDLLVACVGGYQQQFPEHTVKLITHDIGPMTTCRNHSIDFVEIPESWLRPSEKTEEQKENERLKKERLKKLLR